MKLNKASVVFPIRKHNLGMSSNILEKATIGGIIRNKPTDKLVSLVGLNNISFEIKEGERVGLFGMNGAGKTTLLKVLSGVLPPSTGEIKTDGKVTSLLNISLGVDSELSGYENLLLRMIYQNIPMAMKDEMIKAVLDFSELGEFFYLPFKTYSSGMRARLLLALSTLDKPDVLIMDEWISAGDESFKTRAHARLKQFVETSGILVLASHSRSLLETWTTRGIWLDKGRIKADGPTKEVIQEYIAYVKKTNG